MQNVNLAVLTRDLLEDRAAAAKVWQAIASAHADLQPKRYGSYEPLPNKVEGQFIAADAVKEWTQSLFWSNGRRASGSFFFGDPRVHSQISVSCTGSKVPQAVLLALLRELAETTNADFAHIYYRYEDRDEWIRRYNALYPMSLGPTTHDLRRSIPELTWVVVFGEPYVELITPEVLAACPVHSSRRLNDRQWLLQITENPPGFGTPVAEYEIVRDRAKKFLGEEFFLDLSAPNALRRAPRFDWSPEVRNPLFEHLRSNGLLSE